MSYKDNNNNIWCFDIRSFKQLLDKNKLNNPYSREIIPDKEINRITKVLNRLEKQNVSLVYVEDHIYSNEEQLRSIESVSLEDPCPISISFGQAISDVAEIT